VLTGLTDSYSKRLSEKNDLLHENTTIEQYQTMLKEELTGHLRSICKLELKVQSWKRTRRKLRLKRDYREGSRS
jgi:hypothetical protein